MLVVAMVLVTCEKRWGHRSSGGGADVIGGVLVS